MMDPEDLAEARGCVQDNPCWSDCVEVAAEDIAAASDPEVRARMDDLLRIFR